MESRERGRELPWMASVIRAKILLSIYSEILSADICDCVCICDCETDVAEVADTVEIEVEIEGDTDKSIDESFAPKSFAPITCEMKLVDCRKVSKLVNSLIAVSIPIFVSHTSERLRKEQRKKVQG